MSCNSPREKTVNLWSTVPCCAFVVGFVLFRSGCATPIVVVRGTTQEMHYALTANVLSAGEPSTWSRQVLHRTNLTERFNADPAATLDILHKTLAQLSEDRWQDRLFAL